MTAPGFVPRVGHARTAAVPVGDPRRRARRRRHRRRRARGHLGGCPRARARRPPPGRALRRPARRPPPGAVGHVASCSARSCWPGSSASVDGFLASVLGGVAALYSLAVRVRVRGSVMAFAAAYVVTVVTALTTDRRPALGVGHHRRHLAGGAGDPASPRPGHRAEGGDCRAAGVARGAGRGGSDRRAGCDRREAARRRRDGALGHGGGLPAPRRGRWRSDLLLLRRPRRPCRRPAEALAASPSPGRCAARRRGRRCRPPQLGSPPPPGPSSGCAALVSWSLSSATARSLSFCWGSSSLPSGRPGSAH